MPTDLESEVQFNAVVNQSSLRDARKEVEQEFGDIEASVEAAVQGGGSSGGRGRSGQRKGPGSITQTNSYLDGLDDLAIERNDLLRELLDETETGNRRGGRGPLGTIGTIIGGVVGAGAVGLGAVGLADALDNFDPEIPDGIPLTGAPDEVPIEDPDPIPIVDPDPIPIEDPDPIPVEDPGEVPIEDPGRVPVDDPDPVPADPVSPAPVSDPDSVTGPDPASERAIMNDAPTGFEQSVAAPADDPAERSTLRGQAIVGGAGAIASGVGAATDLGVLGGAPQLPDDLAERLRSNTESVWNAPIPTMHPAMPAAEDRPTTGEAVTRLGGVAAIGSGGLIAGGVRTGAAALGLAGLGGSAAADEQRPEGNRSTTRREETNVTIEVDARDSRDSRGTIREIQRQLPELERRLNNLENAFSGRR